MAVAAATSSSNGSPILVLSGQSDQVQVQVKFSQSVPQNLFEKICAAPRFVSWANSYLPRPQQRLKLQSVSFESVEINDDDTIGFIKLHADVLRSPENSQVGGTILLNGPSSAVLVVLRLNPDGSAPGSENTPVYRPDDPEATQQSGPRPREYVLFVKQARPAVGAPEHREMPCGQLRPDGSFVGPAFTAIQAACGLRFYESQMEDLTSLALSAKRTPARSLGISLSPSTVDERIRLYLYRESVSREFIELFQKKRSSEDQITVDLWTLNDAWRITSDAKTLSALFLFHELRYHQLMPRYRPPREAKRSPTFIAVADLNPNRKGLNLRVKIAQALKMIPHPTRPGAQRGIVVVGDTTGVVTLSLDSSQINSVPGCSTVGFPLFLRNVEFDMSDGHITIVLDSFGKASAPSDDEMSQFNFTVNLSNDVSATEYEKVFQTETTSPTSSYNFHSTSTTARTQGGYRGSSRGTRRNAGSRNGFY